MLAVEAIGTESADNLRDAVVAKRGVFYGSSNAQVTPLPSNGGVHVQVKSALSVESTMPSDAIR